MMVDGIERDALLGVFLAEANENVAAMEESLAALRNAPEDGALIATIFRAAHTLKGNCASLGLESVVELAHATEDLLRELRARRFSVTPDLITLLLRAADALKTLVPRAAATPDAPPSSDGALVETLRKSAATGRYVPVAMPAAAPAPDDPRMPAAARTTTVRVHTRTLNLLLDAISELTIARGRVRAVAGAGAGAVTEDALEDGDGLTHLVTIETESELGRGTTFTIRIPPTVAVLHGISARVGAELHVAPLSTVAECLDLPPEAPAATRSGMSSRA